MASSRNGLTQAPSSACAKGDRDTSSSRNKHKNKSKKKKDNENNKTHNTRHNSPLQRQPSVNNHDDQLDEHSPLISENNSNRNSNDDYEHDHDHDDSQETKSMWYLTMLTIGIGGLQMAWSVELSNGSPYLLSLGLTKSMMALVWIAGPLTGTLVQPYVGMLSDNCRLPMGKRRPFMLGGSIATIISLLFLAWTKEIVSGFLGVFGADAESSGVKMLVVVVAVVGIYVLDFAINTVQAAIRCFIVDCAPAHQQEAANAMASRMTGIGNIIGYIAGYSNLQTYLWFFGNSQFKVLCVIASIALGSTVLLSSASIKERDPRKDGPPPSERPGVLAFFFTIFKSIRRLPPQVRRVCQVQFFAWIGFFPLLFYTSSYIGEIYAEPYLEANPHMSPEELDDLYEKATRIGTFALLMNSIVSLLTNVLLPFFVAPTYDSRPVDTDMTGCPSDRSFRLDETEPHSLWDRLRIPGFTIKRAWFSSLVMFALAMFCTVVVRSVEAATALIGLVGITWAMALWAPYAIISAEVSRRDANLRARKRSQSQREAGSNTELSYNASLAEEMPKDGDIDQAGVILGIHNMSIAAPQIIANLGSSLIFKMWQKPRGTPGDHSFAIVLALGGVCVLVSSFFVAQIKDDPGLPSDATNDAEQGEASGEVPSNNNGFPSPAHSRKSSVEMPRTSQDKATLTRNRSLGGMEMHI